MLRHRSADAPDLELVLDDSSSSAAPPSSASSGSSSVPKRPTTWLGWLGAVLTAPRRISTVPRPLLPMFVAGTAFTIVGALALTLAADLLLIGHVKHARDQQTAFADLRASLATITTPVNQTDDNSRLLPLGTALGVIEIPQIGVREVYFEGTTSAITMSGPGHRRDTPMPGQAGTSVIMGRKAGFGGPFNLLDQVTPGAVFSVYSGQGRMTYRVLGLRGPKDAVPIAAAGQSRLTLVTATGDDYLPENVLRVDAVLVTAVQPSGPRPVTRLDLPPGEQAMAGEPGGWLGLVVASLLLFITALLATALYLAWGKRQTWLAAGPALLALGIAVSEQLVRLLPNLL